MKLLVISRNSINGVQMIGSGEAGGCWEVLGFHITLQLEEEEEFMLMMVMMMTMIMTSSHLMMMKMLKMKMMMMAWRAIEIAILFVQAGRGKQCISGIPAASTHQTCKGHSILNIISKYLEVPRKPRNSKKLRETQQSFSKCLEVFQESLEIPRNS